MSSLMTLELRLITLKKKDNAPSEILGHLFIEIGPGGVKCEVCGANFQIS